jgi:hypothetical protein
MVENIENKTPNKQEQKKFRSLELELLEQVKRSANSHRYIEAYMLLWTSIEQFMLPSLIGFISRELKLKLPSKFAELQISQISRLYYFMSHDEELHSEIERVRKIRNKLVHKMYQQKNWKDIKSSFKKGLKDMAKILECFKDRFNGKTPIPSLQLYRNGWNAALEKVINELKNEQGRDASV